MDLANRCLSALNKYEYLDESHPIDRDLLQTFFTHSVRRDNFDGLAHLMNYIEA